LAPYGIGERFGSFALLLIKIFPIILGVCGD
jgi:hypothetical protein